MHETEPKIIKNLDKTVVRAAIFAPATRDGKVVLDADGNIMRELLLTVRPSWSKVGAGQFALAGGRLEIADFDPNFSKENVEGFGDRAWMEAGTIAVMRKVEKELNFLIDEILINFVGAFVNEAGWQTLLYKVELSEKPTVVVKNDSGGTVWSQVKDEQIALPKEMIFADHGEMIDSVLSK